MKFPAAPVSRSTGVSMILFLSVVLLSMGMVMHIDCFPKSATSTEEMISGADVVTGHLFKNPLLL